MVENYHYKGNFEFYYHPTNQIKLSKKYLKEVFPKEAIKLSKKIENKIKDFDAVEFMNNNKSKLIQPLCFYRTDLLKVYLEDYYEKNPELIATLYMILEDVLKTISIPESFNIENELAQTIILNSVNKYVNNEV